MAKKFWIGSSSDKSFNTASNWSPSGAPVTNDELHFTSRSTSDLTDGLDQSATTYDALVVEAGCNVNIGTETADLDVQITGEVRFSGSGQSFVDLNSSDVDVTVENSAAASGDNYGVNLVGTIDDLIIKGGSVGLSHAADDSASCTTINMIGGDLFIGVGLSTSGGTDATIYNGSLITRSTLNDVTVYGGTLTTDLSAGCDGSISIKGGSMIPSGSGSYGAVTVDGGSFDLSRSADARTISSIKVNAGSLIYNPSSVTISAQSEADNPVRVEVARV